MTLQMIRESNGRNVEIRDLPDHGGPDTRELFAGHSLLNMWKS